jgi:hypothetical protein
MIVGLYEAKANVERLRLPIYRPECEGRDSHDDSLEQLDAPPASALRVGG